MKRIIFYTGCVLLLVGFIIGIYGLLQCFGWYYGWLDKYFLWDHIAFIVAAITSPMMVIAFLIEWVWHKFPMLFVAGIVNVVIGGLIGGFGNMLRKKGTQQA